MDLQILILDDHRASLLKPLQDALAPFLDDPATLVGGLDRGDVVELHRILLDQPVRLRIKSNVSQDPRGVLREIEVLRDTTFDLVLLDDDWDPEGITAGLSFAGQEQLLEAVFHGVFGPDKGLPIVVLFTRHWDDQAERIDRYSELLLRPPYSGSLRVTGFHKHDIGSLRLLVQQLVALREAIDARRCSDQRADYLAEILKALGISDTRNAPEDSVHPNLQGRSDVMRGLKLAIHRFAKTDLRFHIFGESGTGKTVVAECVHRLSARAKGPFVSLNLNIPEDVADSALFGHEKGAFTGAITQQTGRIELANKGTLFLDNIDFMSMFLQERFVSFLDKGEFQRLGGKEVLQANVRIISASNRSLEQLVAEGEFRNDLYFRLRCRNCLKIPPLRARREDIPDLIQAYVDKIKLGVEFTPRAISVLQEQSWSDNNIRELEGFLEYASIWAPGNINDVRVRELLDLHSRKISVAPLPAPAKAAEFLVHDPLGQVRSDFRLVESMLERGRGPGEIGKALYPDAADENGRVMVTTFFQRRDVAELLTSLGEDGMRSQFPCTLAYLERRQRSAMTRKGAVYPSWVRMKT